MSVHHRPVERIEQAARKGLGGRRALLYRLGWSPQVPQSRAADRDEEAIATWLTRREL